MYPENLTKPMKEELISVGFQDVVSADQVDALMKEEGTALVVVNSVCGCAAGTARPGVKMAVASASKLPNKLATVFAGVDRESTAKVREYMMPYPASSPSIGLFKDGQLIHFVERHHIEGRSAEMIAEHLVAVFEEYC